MKGHAPGEPVVRSCHGPRHGLPSRAFARDPLHHFLDQWGAAPDRNRRRSRGREKVTSGTRVRLTGVSYLP
jgi:hypothetical protein